ncbi:MAG: LysM peptidoglycan-binding domain-containing protein [Ilumatobacteraceae bacterium]
MKLRSFAVGCGASTLLGLASCGSSGGTGATTATTTVKLNQTSYVTAAPILTSTTTATAADPAAPGSVAGEQIYTVVSGDYPLGIAKKHCIDLATMVAYNAWPEGDRHPFFPGDLVKIPAGACAPGSQPQSTPDEPASVDTTSQETTTTFDPSQGGTYTVVNGDYLGGIAAKTGTTVDAIVAANGWSDGADHLIIPGQKIKLPAKTG